MNWSKYLTYDPVNGELIRNELPRSHFNTNAGYKNHLKRFAGKRSGKVNNVSGYVTVFVEPENRYAHRVIWEMHNGPIPDGMQVDHIDGNRSNNLLCNLRLATNGENQHNRRIVSKSKTGLKGVFWHDRCQYYFSRIQVDGKILHLGCFKTKGLAAVARAKASLRYHGKFTRFS